MFWRPKDKNTYYNGSSSHKYFAQLLRQRGPLLIISPYIDLYYAQILFNLSSKKSVSIITSSADPQALKLLEKRGSILWVAVYTAFSVLLLYAMALFGFAGYYLLISLIPLIIGTIKHWRIRRSISLKVPSQFVHVKMYISNDMAIIGSANLTYKGTHKNVEHVNVIYSKDEIETLTKQFWEMWNSL